MYAQIHFILLPFYTLILIAIFFHVLKFMDKYILKTEKEIDKRINSIKTNVMKRSCPMCGARHDPNPLTFENTEKQQHLTEIKT